MATGPIVASVSIDAVSPDRGAITIEVEIGTPYRRPTGEWACPVSLAGLYERLADAVGEDSFQALCMAISLAQHLLQDFRDEGGALLEFPLEAYAFGPAVRR